MTSADVTRCHDIEIRVRYAETDGQGFLHHANYPVYFEMGRTELFRAQGGSYREFEAGGYFLVVASMELRFRAPARYDDLLVLRTELTRLTPAKLEHSYSLHRDDTLVATGKSVLACLDQQGKVQRMSDVLPNYDSFSQDLSR